jgi:hypothetical protein
MQDDISTPMQSITTALANNATAVEKLQEKKTAPGYFAMLRLKLKAMWLRLDFDFRYMRR